MKKILFSIAISLIALGWAAMGDGAQGTPPDIKVTLALTDSNQNDPRLIYLLNDPVPMVLTLKNNGGSAITTASFTAKPFHLLLTFIDPDGKGITANELDTIVNEPDPPPIIPIDGELLQAEPVETLLNNWLLSTDIPDAHAYYSLTKVGRYSVKAKIPMRTYPDKFTVSGKDYSLIASFNWAGTLESNTIYFSIVADADGDGYYYPEAYGVHTQPDCDDGNPNVNPGVLEIGGNGRDDDCNPATSDGVVTHMIILTPNGGEVLPSGGTYGICWVAPSNTVKFDLKYSTNNGTSWNFIKTVTGLNCTHWEEIPVVTANKNNCRVKVIGYDSNGALLGEDISDKPFTIEVVRIISPNGGETLTSGSTWDIKWVTKRTVRPVAKTVLKYTTDGTTWKAIKTLSDNPENYSWTVPAVSSIKGKVKVILKDASGANVGTDVSDMFFTIQP